MAAGADVSGYTVVSEPWTAGRGPVAWATHAGGLVSALLAESPSWGPCSPPLALDIADALAVLGHLYEKQQIAHARSRPNPCSPGSSPLYSLRAVEGLELKSQVTSAAKLWRVYEGRHAACN